VARVERTGMKIVTYAARTLALLWAGFWMLFFTAESLVWNTPLDRMIIWMTIGLAFLIVALVAWRWEVVGGVLLIAVGIVSVLAYYSRGPRPISTTTLVTTLLAFGIPPTGAGVLFLIHHYGIGRAGVARG
jgi:hypothetical protein